ncbi:MAG TPA: alanine--tRNA ligase-related protein, partial [Solirubrobacteraceae bacterium]|nr:alanine--tRNA ligase-related protein [Solirubrobacteraceae bacterium]
QTLDQGTKLLDDLIARARDRGETAIAAADAFALHDTYGFPFDLTYELVAEQALTVDEAGFEELMNQQRKRARAGATARGGGAADDERSRAQELVAAVDHETVFTGYETLEQPTTVAAVARVNGRAVAKLAESPFYAAGGGQVSDVGIVECEQGACRARVAEVFRIGDDQAVALELEQGELKQGERVIARVDASARHATESNHTATHLLHAALRARLGSHVRQAGSAVQPDKLRFDFTHGQALSDAELHDVEDQVNEWILANEPVRALTTTLDEARGLGAMALFGEKYGDVVRMVQIGDGRFSRELCGGTHVRSTAEIGVFRMVSESSSAANVRRIEALTGPAAVELLRRHDELLETLAGELGARPDQALDVLRAHERQRSELDRAVKEAGGGAGDAVAVEELAQRASDHGGTRVLAATLADVDAKSLLEIVDRLKGMLGDAVIVLGSATDGRVHFVASVAPAIVERGVRAGEIVKTAAELTGGGGGGRDTLARAGGRDPSKLEQAIEAARAAIEARLA